MTERSVQRELRREGEQTFWAGEDNEKTRNPAPDFVAPIMKGRVNVVAWDRSPSEMGKVMIGTGADLES